MAAIDVSTGFLAGIRGRAARRLEKKFLGHMRNLLASAPLLHADETVLHEAPQCDRVEARGLHRRAVVAAR